MPKTKKRIPFLYRGFLLSILWLLFYTIVSAAEKGEKPFIGNYYFVYGLNVSNINKHDIHVTHSKKGHDFTLVNAKAIDGDFVSENPLDIGDNQFQLRFGRRLYANWDIEFSIEHNKYILTNQHARVKGRIFGESVDRDLKVGPNENFQLEHTDGYNHFTVNLVYKFPLISSSDFTLDLYGVGGIGKMIPVTGSDVFGEERDHKYRIAGNTYSGGIGLRRSFTKRCFVQSALKTYMTDVYDAKLAGGATAKHKTVSQTWQLEVGCYLGKLY